MSSTVATSQQVLNTNIDIYWLNWLFLAESIFGFLTNTVNFVVFANQRRFKEIRYKYILVKTIANWLYFILNTMSAFLTYCLDCSSTQTYFAAVYSVYVSLYLCSSLTGLRELIQLAMSVRTYLVMAQKSTPSKSYYILVIILLTILSLVTYLYIPFAFGFFQNPLTGAYLYYLNSFGSSKTYYVLVLVQTFLFIVISAVAVAFLNCANMISFKRWLFRRRVKRVVNSQAVLFEAEPNIAVAIAMRNEALTSVKNSSHDEATQIKKNLTKTIIISLSFNIVFEIAFSIMLLLIAFYSTAANFFRLSMIGIIIHNIAPSLDLFVYYYVNKLFRKVLSSMFKCSRTTT